MEHIKDDVDVLVIGGGTAGTIAAIQSARSGQRTALLESGSQLGGVTTTGGVSFPGLFHAWGRQIVAGIGWELVTKAVALDSGKMPDFSVPPLRHWWHQIRINGPVYAALAEEACLQSEVELHYYEIPTEVSETENGWKVKTVGKGISRLITTNQLIDCTGGADIVGAIGLPRLREEETQPGTLIFKLAGYDVESLDERIIQANFMAAMEDGRLQHGDISNPQGRFIDFLGSGGENAQHVFGADSSTSDRHTKTNIAGRQSLLRILRFVRSLPGCKNARVMKAQAETAVRETYRIVGEEQVSYQDYISGWIFDDAVSYSFYPIDLHDRDGVRPQPLAEGIVATVPLRALIPKGSKNLLVAGRSVSSDRLANSALRVQASSMAMGQAAGAAAALSASQEATPSQIQIAELRELLLQHQAIVPIPEVTAISEQRINANKSSVNCQVNAASN